MNKELYELAVEISGISMIITGLSNNLDEECTHLTKESLHTALFSVSSHLERIVEDLNAIEKEKALE